MTVIKPDEMAVPADRAASDLMDAQEKIQNLQVALLTSRRIGMAIGILMASDKVDEDGAFDRLRLESQRANRKLRDVAEDVILTGTI